MFPNYPFNISYHFLFLPFLFSFLPFCHEGKTYSSSFNISFYIFCTLRLSIVLQVILFYKSCYLPSHVVLQIILSHKSCCFTSHVIDHVTYVSIIILDSKCKRHLYLYSISHYLMLSPIYHFYHYLSFI